MPSLYQPTPETGTVSTTNLTSLYSNTTNFTTGLVTSAVNSVNGGTGVTVNPTTGNVVVSIGQDVATSANVTFANVTATGNLSNNYYTLANAVGTNGQVLTTNGAGATSWTALSSIGVTSITGTANQVIASSSTGAITLSTPQDIATTSNPTFAGATLGNILVALGDNNTITTTLGDLELTGFSGIVNTTNLQATLGGAAPLNGLNLYSNNADKAIHLYDDYVQIVSGTNGDWIFNPDGTTDFPNYKFPVADGTANQVLTTNGAGIVSWALPGGGGSTFGNITVGIVTDNTISTTTGNLALTATGNNGVTIDSGSIAPTTITRISTPTNTNIRSLALNSQTSGTPAVGIGNSIEFQVETGVGVTTAGGYLSVTSTDITAASEDFKMSFGLMAAGATYSEKASLSSTGDLQIDGDLTVTGNNINSSSATALNLSGDDVTVVGDLGVGGGTVATTAVTANLFNTNATTLNIGGAATAVNIGAATGSTIINADLNVNGTTLTLDANNAGAGANSTIAANRGSSGADATLTWTESTGFWSFSNDVFAAGSVIGGTSIGTNGNNINFNNEDGSPAADCFITVKKPGVGDPQIKWNEATLRWQTTVDGSTYLNIPNQNLDTTDNVAFGDLTVSGGNVSLTNGTSNIIDWAAAGTGAPAFTTRTAGTKAVLYPSLSGSTTDYALGIDAATMWSSVPENNDSFKFKWYGATTEIATLSGVGNLQIDGNLDVQGGTITESTGALTISTGASNGAITLDPNGTGNVICTFSNGGNLTNDRNYVFGAIRNATTQTTNGDIWELNTSAAQGAANPYYRGLSLDNSADTTRGPATLMRSYSGGAVPGSASRGRVIFEKARGTAASPTAVTSGDILGGMDATGYTSTGWLNDTVAAVPATSFFTAAESWVSNTNLGSTYGISLAPTATTITSGANLIPVLSVNPQTAAHRSDAFTISQGKSGSATYASLGLTGNTFTGTGVSNFIRQTTTNSTTPALLVRHQRTDLTTPADLDGVDFRLSVGGTVTSYSVARFDAQYRTSGLHEFGISLSNDSFATDADTVYRASPEKTMIQTTPAGGGTVGTTAEFTQLATTIKSNALTLQTAAGAALPSGKISYGRQYIEAYSTQDQTNPVANAENLMSFNNTGISNGVSIVTNGTTLSRITMANAGLYNIQFSAQLSQTSGGNHNAFIWLKKNGTTVANTAGDVKVAGNGDRIMASWNYIVDAAASDYYELAWAATDTTVVLDYVAASAPIPAIPSVILTVVPVGA